MSDDEDDVETERRFVHVFRAVGFRVTVDDQGRRHSHGDEPAVIDPNQTRWEWWKNGRLHRDGDKPAIISFEGPYGTKKQEWWFDGKPHRDGGQPAVDTGQYIDNDNNTGFGPREWWLHGQRHREDGAAIQSDRGKWGHPRGERYFLRDVEFPDPLEYAVRVQLMHLKPQGVHPANKGAWEYLVLVGDIDLGKKTLEGALANLNENNVAVALTICPNVWRPSG